MKDKLVELCEVLVALRSASLDQYPLTPAGQPPDDRRFAEVLLTSHLQTMGSTVVVADSPNIANKVGEGRLCMLYLQAVRIASLQFTVTQSYAAVNMLYSTKMCMALVIALRHYDKSFSLCS